MSRNQGFTLLETIIASTIVAIVMLGMMGLLATHSKSSNKFKDATFAANLAQQEVDVILADLKVQRSLAASSSGGRAAKKLLYNVKLCNTTITYVLDYFSGNFREIDPQDPDYEMDGPEDAHIHDPVHYFDLAEGNRFYKSTGAFIDMGTKGATFAGSDARYVTRVQIYGIPNADATGNNVFDDRSLANIETGTYLMGDTDSGTSLATLANIGVPMRKLIVVKIYDYNDYLDAPASGLAAIPEKKVMAKAKVIVFGDV